MTTETRKKFHEVLVDILDEFGGLGGFQNEEGIVIQPEELPLLVKDYELESSLDLLIEHFSNLDWITRVQDLRKTTPG